MVCELKFLEGGWKLKNVENIEKPDFDERYLPNQWTKSQSVIFYKKYELRATTFAYKVFDEKAWFESYKDLKEEKK